MILPSEPARAAKRILPEPQRRRREDRHLVLFAASKIATASVSDAAIGLSMKHGLPAWSTGSSARSAAGRRSFEKDEIDPLHEFFDRVDNLDVQLFHVFDYSGTTYDAGFDAGFPSDRPRPFDNRPLPASACRREYLVNSFACEVSKPMMPALSGFSSARSFFRVRVGDVAL